MAFDFSNNPFFRITSIPDGLRLMLSGIPGGFYTANHILKVAGSHSNRTMEQIYDTHVSDLDKETELVDLVILRLISEMDVITNRNELCAGVIMLMSSGILLNHWRKFKLSTDFDGKKYESIYIKQMRFETRKWDVMPTENMESEARNFNKIHEWVNTLVQGYYSNLEPTVDTKFGELFTLLSIQCNMSMEEYDELIKYRYQLLERTKNENYATRLLKGIASRCTEMDIWSDFLRIKEDISTLLVPNKTTLYPMFDIKKGAQKKYQDQFIAHFKYGFHDDLNDILNRLDLEVE